MNVFADIPDDAPEDQIFFLDGGVPVRTGLIEDEIDMVEGVQSFADRVGVKTKDEIAKLLAEPTRKAGRKRFGNEWIKNQGRRGSCAAYAGASVLEKSRVLRGQNHVKLGPEWAYAHANGGRDRGALLNKVISVLQDKGCPRSELVPYESYLLSQQKTEAEEDAKRFKILFEEYFGISSEEELATALAMNFPVLIACHVNNNWMKLDSDGVVMPTDGMGNHAIHLDDVRISSTGEYQFDHAGSWGLRYGQNGRGWTTWRRHYKTTVRYHQFVAVRSTIDDPQGQQLPKRSA